jgi:hypothetical protein
MRFVEKSACNQSSIIHYIGNRSEQLAEKTTTPPMKNTPAKNAAHEKVAHGIAYHYLRQIALHENGKPFGTLAQTFDSFRREISERVRRMASMLGAHRINVDLDLVQRMARAEISLELNSPNGSELKTKLSAIRSKQAA